VLDSRDIESIGLVSGAMLAYSPLTLAHIEPANGKHGNHRDWQRAARKAGC